jgi:cell division inhibitor SepF
MVESLLKRAKAFIGLEEDEGGLPELPREEMNVETALRPRKNKNSNALDYEIAIYEPKVYEDSLNISMQLRGGNPVIINLRHLDPNEGTRLIDFVSGTTYAIDGHMIKIGESIFLFTPSNIGIADIEEHSSLEESFPADNNTLFARR